MKINGHDITAKPAAVPVGEVPKLGRLLTPEEAATVLQVPRSWIYQHTRRRSLDRIPFVKVGRYTRFREKDIFAYIDKRTVRD